MTSLGEGNNYHAPYIVYCCRRVAASWWEVANPVTSLGEGNNYHTPYIVYCCRRVAAS